MHNQAFPPSMTLCFAMDFHYSERIGGAEVQAWLLAKELARRGYRVVYVAQSLSGKAGVVEALDGVEIHWLEPARLFQWEGALRYYRLLKCLDPDYLIQRMTSFTSGVIAWYAKRHHKPFAWICTDDRIPNRWHFVRNEWKALAKKNLAKKLARPVWLSNALLNDVAKTFGLSRVTYAFAQNEIQARRLQQNYGLRCQTMPSGHALPERHLPAIERFQQRKIIWIANLGARKQPQKFVALARQLQHTNVHLQMIGGHDDQTWVRTIFAAKPANLHWAGRLPFAEAEKHFDDATLFVNTSEADSEGFPNTFIQAWLRGVPVMTLGVDPDDIIQKHRLGIVASSLPQLRQQIEELLQDRQRYLSLSQQVADYARAHHSIEHVADTLLRCFMPAVENTSLMHHAEQC